MEIQIWSQDPPHYHVFYQVQTHAHEINYSLGEWGVEKNQWFIGTIKSNSKLDFKGQKRPKIRLSNQLKLEVDIMISPNTVHIPLHDQIVEA